MDILTESKPKQIEKSFDSLQPMEMEEVVPLPKKKPIGSVESLSSNEMTRKVTNKELSLQKERDESAEASNNSLCIKIPPKQASDMKSNTPPRSPLTKAPKSPLTSNSDLTKPRAPQSPLVTAEVLSRSPFSHLTNTEGPRSPFAKTENVIPLPIAQVKEIVTEKESESASRSSSFKSTKRVSFHNTNGDAPPIVEAVADKVVGDDIKVDAVPEQVSKEPRSRSTSGSSARRPSIPKRPTATETTEPQMVTSPITSPIIKDPKSEQNMQAVLEMIKQSSQTSINPLPQQKAGPRKHSNTVTSPSSSDQWPRTNPLLRETSIRSTRIDSSASQRTETSGIRSRLPSSSSTDPRFRAGSIADPRFRSGSILEKDEKRIMTKNSTLTMLDVKTDVKRTVTEKQGHGLQRQGSGEGQRSPLVKRPSEREIPRSMPLEKPKPSLTVQTSQRSFESGVPQTPVSAATTTPASKLESGWLSMGNKGPPRLRTNRTKSPMSTQADEIESPAIMSPVQVKQGFVVRDNIHLVNAYPASDPLFALQEGWDKTVYPDQRYNLYRRALFDTLPLANDFPLLVPLDLQALLYENVE